MVLLQLLFLGTKLGLALRAVAINPQSAAFSGLPVGRLLMVGWGLAAGARRRRRRARRPVSSR